MSEIFIIADDKNAVMEILVPMFGETRHICAIFTREQDALEVLWASQDQLDRPHAVQKVSGFITVGGFQ